MIRHIVLPALQWLVLYASIFFFALITSLFYLLFVSCAPPPASKPEWA